MDEEAALSQARQAIDAIDRELIRLLNARAAQAIEIGRIKRAGGATGALYRAEREAEVLRRARDGNPGPMGGVEVVRILREVMSACLALEEPLRVAYLGPAGTYTHAAAVKHFGSAVHLIPQPGIDEVIREVEVRGAHFGVVPIENSLEGPVNQTHDALQATPLAICGEVILPIQHQLLGLATDPARLQRVYAHAQALAQCRHWLDAHCPQVERIPASSNAEAARRICDEADAAAIASRAAAELYGVPVMVPNIADRSDNTTRFLVLGDVVVACTGDDVTSLVFATHNRAGALCDVLRTFAEGGISLSRIQSRPLRQGNWDYLFFVDIVGHRTDPVVARALDALHGLTSHHRILGSYPRAVL
jgi:chorismate mutase/prephenate dehydratase